MSPAAGRRSAGRPGDRALAARASEAPASPGVYCFLGESDELLYVGKAKQLRRRLADWARGVPDESALRAQRLLAAVCEVRWVECSDERAALCREADAIVSLAPRFNAVMKTDAFMFVSTVRSSGGSRGSRLRFALGEDALLPGARTYGAFPHLGKGKISWRAVRTNAGYSALVRLVWAAFNADERAQMPAKLRGSSPPVEVSLDVDPDAASLVHGFLGGRSRRLLDTLRTAAASDAVAAFMRPALERDVVDAGEFYELGPRALHLLRRRHGLATGTVDRELYARLIADDLRRDIGPFAMPGSPTA